MATAASSSSVTAAKTNFPLCGLNGSVKLLAAFANV